ncbi:hypothetical protein V494_03819 [Pseudogymnoascus sp. VKM F-4513 (FW-928)]|nr:hypothetical protein V494_03819 [Pseudogymnoascus sp. VKM F-4513 (FW-928)]
MPPRFLEPGRSTPSYQVPSFTPVNQPVRSSWGKNSDALYDIPQDDDPLPISQPPQKRKRRLTASTRNKSEPGAHAKKPRRKDDSPLSKRFAYVSKPDEHILPQPSLPLGMNKSASRRTNSALSQQTKVFSNTTISKPNSHRSYGNDTLHKQSTEFTINAPSTLDRIAQAGNVGLARTTLEKLAAFRFKTSDVDVEFDQATLGRTTSLNPPTDTANLGTGLYSHDQSITNEENDSYPSPTPDDALSPVEHEAYECVSHQTLHAPASFINLRDEFGNLFDDTSNIYCSVEAPGSDDNYGCVYIDESKRGRSGTLERSSSIYRDSAIGAEIGDLPSSRDHADPQEWDEGLDDEYFAQLDSDDLALPLASQSAPVLLPVENGSDDFDDSVADDDLMKVMVEYDNVHSYSGHQQPTTPPNNRGEPSIELENVSRSSLRLQSTDDEYFMDETDEIELANLAEQDDPVIIETHSPPSNWTQSDARSRDREVYDEKLNHSSPWIRHDENIINKNQLRVHPSVESLTEPEDWSFLNHNRCVSGDMEPLCNKTPPATVPVTPRPSVPYSSNDDSHEYVPLAPFARSPFPEKVANSSAIPGLTTCTILRTCFRIGECIRAGSLCSRVNQDAIIELFCRVTFSSREDGTHKQIFQFADIFHDGPPFVNGVLTNYRVSALQERESGELLPGNREDYRMLKLTIRTDIEEPGLKRGSYSQD